VLVPRSSGTPVATWAWPTWVVSRRRVLEAVFILLEFPSPSRRIFIGSHSLPPLWFAVSVLHSLCRSLCHSSSTTSPTPCVRVPRIAHAARRRLLRLRARVRVPRHVARLVVDYFASRSSSSTTSPRAGSSSTTSPRAGSSLTTSPTPSHPGASACCAARHAARRRLLRALLFRLAATLALLQPHCAPRLLVPRQHWLYFEYVARRRDVVFWSHHVDHSSPN
jgi:hypothetical protein